MPGTGSRPVQFFRNCAKPVEYSPMLPFRSAYTIFSEGTFQRFAAASNAFQLLARSTANDARYPAVPGSAPTHRSASARFLSCHNTGPCPVNFNSTVTACPPRTLKLSVCTCIRSQPCSVRYCRGSLGVDFLQIKVLLVGSKD